jgi:hypothetical protein
MESKTVTLEHIRLAQDELANALANQDLTSAECKALLASSKKLRAVERTIVQTINQTLVTQLATDAAALKTLATEIKTSGEKLARVAAIVEKAAKLLDTFVSAATSALGSGLL